jgi:putative ABC transport system substrate-binding protein
MGLYWRQRSAGSVAARQRAAAGLKALAAGSVNIRLPANPAAGPYCGIGVLRAKMTLCVNEPPCRHPAAQQATDSILADPLCCHLTMQFDRLRRREFITLLGGAAAAWPLAARGQQPAPSVIGMLMLPGSFFGRWNAFRAGLSETGYHEGRNVVIESKWNGQYDRLPPAAADLVRQNVAVIVAASTPGAVAAKAATHTVPIVFNVGVDPVESGLVASLNRPGGNLTGVSTLNVELASKQLEMLHEVVPAANSIAILANPSSPAFAGPLLKHLDGAAGTLGLTLHVVHASAESELEAAFATVTRLRAGALLIASDPFLNSRSEQLAAYALRHGVPTMHQIREFPAAGGLMGYGSSIPDSYRLMGVYTGRILKGGKPADLPVQQVTKVELVINLNAAKALGVTFPAAVLARADEVIE